MLDINRVSDCKQAQHFNTRSDAGCGVVVHCSQAAASSPIVVLASGNRTHDYKICASRCLCCKCAARPLRVCVCACVVGKLLLRTRVAAVARCYDDRFLLIFLRLVLYYIIVFCVCVLRQQFCTQCFCAHASDTGGTRHT